jgi:hypothetical protein
MNQDYEKLIDEIINLQKTGGDLSTFKKNRNTSSLVTLISKLSDFPKASVPNADFMRIKNQILDRISVPEIETTKAAWFGFSSLPQILRVGAGALGSLLIVVSLALGTAVAALNSNPGQTIYPLKKVVENIQLRLAPDNDKTNLQIKFANNRVDELALVIQQQQDGEISAPQAQKIVAATIKELQKNTQAAATATTKQPATSVADQLADLSTKLRIASIKTEGEVKIELEQAIKDIEEAGGGSTDDSVSAQGKLTSVSSTTLSIGTAKFLITKDTKYINVTAETIEVDQVVDIQGQIIDNKTYAQTVTLVAESKISGTDVQAETTDPDTNTETPSAQ